MEILNKNFFNGLINLDTFSRLPPNTDIHLSKAGYFYATCGKMSSIIGAQTMSNLYNGYTPEKTVSDLDLFFHEFIEIIHQFYELAVEDESMRIETTCKINIAYRDFKNAYGNHEHGLVCLLNTYNNNLLVEVIEYTRSNLAQYKKWCKKWSAPTDCPESDFTDDDWEHYIQNSKLLQYETTSLYKFYLQYSSSLLYNQTMNNIGIWHWYDLIHDMNGVKIYLGGMPLKSGQLNMENRNDLITIQNLNVKAVLSVVEGFENRSDGYIYSPITPDQWGEIKFCQIPIPDFGTISLDKIHTCVEYIHWNIKNKRSIYISCRIGKSRSMLVLMAYFVKHLNYTSQQAYEYIKSKRVQVQNKHFKLLQQYEQIVKK